MKSHLSESARASTRRETKRMIEIHDKNSTSRSRNYKWCRTSPRSWKAPRLNLIKAVNRYQAAQTCFAATRTKLLNYQGRVVSLTVTYCNFRQEMTYALIQSLAAMVVKTSKEGHTLIQVNTVIRHLRVHRCTWKCRHQRTRCWSHIITNLIKIKTKCLWR